MLFLRDFYLIILSNDTLYQWYALYTRSRAEKKVYEKLKEIGIDVYLPLRKELRHWSDRKKWIEKPVINSYIFVNIPRKDYLRVFEARGVVAYVSANKKAVIIPDCEMRAMQQAVKSNLSFNVEASSIRKGQLVTIASGPLKGITGEIFETQGSKKLYLRISHIGYSLVVDLSEDENNK